MGRSTNVASAVRSTTAGPARRSDAPRTAPTTGSVHPPSLTTLTTPYQDTDADQLSFSLDWPVRDALAVRDVTVGGLDVQLRLLGASHQVFAGPVGETVACLPGAAGGLPDTVREFDGWEYSFAARVRIFTGAVFSARVAKILRVCGAHPRALSGVFPGLPDAVTALVADPWGAGLTWHTWHTYPQSRRIVATHSRLEAR
ncbi:DUF2617 family protein [Streptomyces sp. NPDC048290]|uniref:DUF2617 family protein n=1 Tax=Streptomyces sp. NPDC048290 TaxID=3155811 RepID=UPI0034433B49